MVWPRRALTMSWARVSTGGSWSMSKTRLLARYSVRIHCVIIIIIAMYMYILCTYAFLHLHVLCCSYQNYASIMYPPLRVHIRVYIIITQSDA